MSTHWIRDVQIESSGGYDRYGNHPELGEILFHFLRVAGWSHIWECDGANGDNPNHVDDGNMEETGVSKYTPVGGNIFKVTSPIHSGTRSLHVEASASGHGVESSALLSMSNSTDYHFSVWAHNNNADPWWVLVDDGSGSFVPVGIIPPNGGVYTRYEFDFTSHTSGTRYLKFESQAAGSLYIDGIMLYQSFYEYASYESDTDGILTNPDEFSTAGSYTPGASDIGKFLFVFDGTNPKNSGCYEITADLGGGSVQVNLRSSTASFTTQSGLTWRIVDLENIAPDDGSVLAQRTAGFGLESNHGSGWRLFVRQNMFDGSNSRSLVLWSSPEDTDFDFSTGTFYTTGPSTQRNRQNAFTSSSATSIPKTHMVLGPYFYIAGTYTTRTFVKTDDDGSYISLVHWGVTGSDHATMFAGYAGSDPYHPGVMEFSFLTRWESQVVNNEIDFAVHDYNFGYEGTGFDDQGLALRCCAGQYGYGTSTAYPEGQSNAQANPISGEEWLRPLIIITDPDGTNYPSERETSIGIYQGRKNLPDLATFDSNAYIHFENGLVWEWMGESL